MCISEYQPLTDVNLNCYNSFICVCTINSKLKCKCKVSWVKSHCVQVASESTRGGELFEGFRVRCVHCMESIQILLWKCKR